MDRSIYTPGAGHQPPVLAGRDALLRDWGLMLNDVAAVGRRRARDLVLVGPRGVGKTVAMTALGRRAADQGFEVVGLQAVAGQAGLVDALRHRARTGVDERSGPWQRAKHAFDNLEGLSMSVAGVGAGLTRRSSLPVSPPQDAGTVAHALATLAREVRHDTPQGGLLVTVDEMQVAAGPDLALLAATLHRLNVDHPTAVVVFAGTGLPTVTDALRRAGVTHPDRLFTIEPLEVALAPDDARYAVVEPARQVGVVWDPDAVDALVEACNGYPAHLQLFADATWRRAKGPTRVTLDDVRDGLTVAAVDLERRTLGPRWERITDREMEFLAALALHGGHATTRTIATTLGRTPQDLSWLRQALIVEGDVYAPRRGRLSMAVPLLARYVLTHYEHARGDAATPLLSLEQMCANAGLPVSTDDESQDRQIPSSLAFALDSPRQR